MFTMKMDGYTLWSPIDNKLKVVSPTLKLEVNKIGSLSFKIHPDHPYFTYFVRMKSIISVHQGNRTLFKGRVYGDGKDFHNGKKVEVEGLLGYFNDSRVRPYEFTGSVTEYFTMLVDQHNNQVEEHQRFKVGVVTVTDPNDYITRASSDTPKTWVEIENKLIKLLGGYISIRYEDDGNYVDYLADYTDTSTQSIAFAVNLLDLNREGTGDSLATCIIPYGAKDEATGNRIDITSVNDGVDYIYDAEAVAKYGKIFEVVTWDDVTLPLNLKTKAALYLANKVQLPDKTTVKAVDLHLADETIEAFKLGDYVQVYSEPHGIDDRVLLTAYSMDLTNPSGCTITLGLEKSSYLGNQADANKDVVNRVDSVQKEVSDSNTTIVNQVLSETQSYVNSTVSNSEKNTQTLLQEYVKVTELETIRQETSLEISQTAEALNLQFDSLNERIETENGEVNRHLEESSKYIRFIDGNIILGEEGALLTTKLANGRISFLYNDSVEVAYISDQKLYITQAEVLEQITIGNFAFIPRKNGNLSFKKVR